MRLLAPAVEAHEYSLPEPRPDPRLHGTPLSMEACGLFKSILICSFLGALLTSLPS